MVVKCKITTFFAYKSMKYAFFTPKWFFFVPLDKENMCNFASAYFIRIVVQYLNSNFFAAM